MTLNMLHLALLLLIASFTLSSLFTAMIKKHSQKTGFVAKPREDRYHKKIIALGGGIAIFWTLLIFMLSSVAIVKWLIEPGKLPFIHENVLIHTEGFVKSTRGILTIAAAISALHLLGLVDDKKHLGPIFKLLSQFVIVIAAIIFADIRSEFCIQNKSITTCISAFWIVLIMNAFNFLDNMDGLSAGIAVIACSVLLTAAIISGQIFISGLTIVFIGTLLGFLVFNFPPASIFMGDSGSLVLGFMTALITLRTTYYHEGAGTNFFAIFMPIVAMAVPLYDFISVTAIRIKQGKSPFVGDTQHFSHRLKRRGLTDTQTTLTLYLATLCTGIGAILLYKASMFAAVLIFAQTIMILAIIAIFEMTGKNES